MIDLQIEFESFYEKQSGSKPLTWAKALEISKMPPDDTIGHLYFTLHAKDCFAAFKAGYAAAGLGVE